MARPTIEPVTTANLPEFADFLHRHLNPGMSPQQWQQALQPQWPGGAQGNHGFVLLDGGQVVGGIGALYAERQTAGQTARFCNITSWCVLDSHRQHSMRLAMAVVGQPGFHFTDFSPTQIVGGTLRFLKFQPLDDAQLVMPNLPSLGAGKVVHRSRDIESVLSADLLQCWRDHSAFPWLKHVVVGRPGAWCHVIYKRRVFKHLPCASVVHVSDGTLFSQHWPALSRHLLSRGLLSTQVEKRLVGTPPRLHAVRTGFNQKLFRSDTLLPQHIDSLYSESVGMDL
jgi:hypothetical protein